LITGRFRFRDATEPLTQLRPSAIAQDEALHQSEDSSLPGEPAPKLSAWIAITVGPRDGSSRVRRRLPNVEYRSALPPAINRASGCAAGT
jgi:hypothetical protein